jgi:hypothetical protein
MSEFYIVSNELYHHGILGQKWGVRRFQNPDGTWTDAGRKRYGSGSSKEKNKFANKGVIGAAKDKYEFHIDENDNKIAKNTFLAAVAGFTIGTILLVTTGYGGSVMYESGKMLAGLSTSKLKESFAKKRYENSETDPKTGFKLKSEETTPKSDVKKVNPGYYNFNNNTKNNCVLCSTAYEMRRRGYEMTAPPASSGWNKNPKFFKGEKHKDFYDSTGWSKVKITDDNINEYRSKLSGWITEETTKQGNGARGELHIVWSTGNGHSVAYEIANNELMIYDAQTGETYKGFNKFKDVVNNVSYARRDNLEFNTEELKRYGFK